MLPLPPHYRSLRPRGSSPKHCHCTRQRENKELENKLAALTERNQTLEGLTNEAKLGEWQVRAQETMRVTWAH